MTVHRSAGDKKTVEAETQIIQRGSKSLEVKNYSIGEFYRFVADRVLSMSTEEQARHCQEIEKRDNEWSMRIMQMRMANPTKGRPAMPKPTRRQKRKQKLQKRKQKREAQKKREQKNK